MNPDERELWRRIEAFDLDEPGAVHPFSARLAHQNGWTPDHTLRVIGEYRRFAFLCAAAGHPCTSNRPVDAAWHLHLLYTRSYWERFCPQVLRQSLHHEP